MNTDSENQNKTLTKKLIANKESLVEAFNKANLSPEQFEIISQPLETYIKTWQEIAEFIATL